MGGRTRGIHSSWKRSLQINISRENTLNPSSLWSSSLLCFAVQWVNFKVTA